MTTYATLDEINAAREELEASIDGWQAPVAYGLGVGTVSPNGSVLDVAYPHVNGPAHRFPALALAKVLGHTAGSGTYEMSSDQLDAAIATIEPAEACTDVEHPNLEAFRLVRDVAQAPAAGGERRVFACFMGSLDDPPTDAAGAYLRLHLLSYRVQQPNSMNLDGMFGVLSNAVWTNHGPFQVDGFEAARMRLKAEGKSVEVHLVDKFPRMLDYVIPSGVRVADANRVRMGAHLAEGTTVMHEGFCNFNAGTLGVSMVEGRISQGVIVDDGSDVGGGAATMGTLSGGGTERVRMGKNCLLGSNSGLGIALGDECVVEAGLYLTAGTLVVLPDGETTKARELSGASNLLFRRNSLTGAVEALPRAGVKWEGLNAALHAN